MRKVLIAVACLTLLVIPTEAIILAKIRLNPLKLAAFLECLSLALGAMVALTQSQVVRELRHRATESTAAAFATPFVLMIPYFILAIGTGSFSFRGTGKLLVYIAVPTLLLLPDRLHRAQRVGWRDVAAMLALAVPVGTRWLSGIWTWPEEVYFFRPIFCVCIGAYCFIVLRGLDSAGYKLIPRKGDLGDGLANLLAFALLGIPLGIFLGFIHPHSHSASVWYVAFQLFGIYLTVAIPEELMFRGILQNVLEKTWNAAHSESASGKRGGWRNLAGLVVASIVFGAAHLHHPPVPNWRYGLMATLAGLFYGNAWRSRHRLPASALTHAVVDTMWHFWF